MSSLCGWLSFENPSRGTGDAVVRAMCRALKVHSGQVRAHWSFEDLSLGTLDLPAAEPLEVRYAPAVSHDERFYLWMCGEAYAGGAAIDIPQLRHSRTMAFRKSLLEEILRHGPEIVSSLDGVYVIVFWDAQEKNLVVLNDRFASLPLYWSCNAQGFAFASGVRGVLMAPAVNAEPDGEAIREQVTFGGFRLADRTNVASVKLVPPATIISVKDNHPHLRKYQQWPLPPMMKHYSLSDLVDKVHLLWQQSIERRLSDEGKPGQMLSGGLDSRAVLAEASPRLSGWTSITWGVPNCDDVRFAQRAAKAMGVNWLYCPPYQSKKPDWLERRSAYIQQTDGLMQLADLFFVESLPLVVDALDVNFTGHPGCVVCGTLYYDIIDAPTLIQQMPYYATKISWPYQKALDWAEGAVAALGSARANYAIFEHKFPQAIIQIFNVFSPWMQVRHPFLDYELFDFYAALPMPYRKQVYYRMLQKFYPGCYRSIPWQRTGMPVWAPDTLIQLERVRRFACRNVQLALQRCGIPVTIRTRYYQLEDVFWRTPDAYNRIKETIMRPGSLCCQIFGREVIASLLKEWFEFANAPIQVIGALYVYEAYFRDLSSHLSAARIEE